MPEMVSAIMEAVRYLAKVATQLQERGLSVTTEGRFGDPVEMLLGHRPDVGDGPHHHTGALVQWLWAPFDISPVMSRARHRLFSRFTVWMRQSIIKSIQGPSFYRQDAMLFLSNSSLLTHLVLQWTNRCVALSMLGLLLQISGRHTTFHNI